MVPEKDLKILCRLGDMSAHIRGKLTLSQSCSGLFWVCPMWPHNVYDEAEGVRAKSLQQCLTL